MKRGGNVITIDHSGKRAHTFALRSDKETGAVERMISGVKSAIATLQELTPVRVKRAIRWMAQPRVILPVAVVVVALFATGAYYYTRLAAEIDQRLRGGFFDDSVGIFSSPFKVAVGDRLSIDEIVSYLQAAGYQQRESVSGSKKAYSVSGRTVEISPGDDASSTFNLSPVRFNLDGDGRIASITSLATGGRLDSAEIEGELLATVRDGDRRKRITVAFSDIPEKLKGAIIAVEDRRFFDHNGIDWRGIGRALWKDASEGGIVQGGSTITQQLIKNAFLTSERTFSRKLKEAAMAVILESRLSKEEIFTLYCNNVYLGQSGTFAVHGFAEAAQVYFGKRLDDLTLGEAAFLAGLVHAPNRYSSDRDRDRATDRRNQVLDAMVETGAVTVEEAVAAKALPVELKKREVKEDFGTSYFIDYVQRYLEERYGEKGVEARRRVNTSMDPRLQRAAYESVTRHTARLDRQLGRAAAKGEEPARVQAALIALDAHTGEVLAMIGGRDYSESQLNRATDARRQPGSTFKPFVYAKAISSRGYTASSLLSDKPQTFSYDGGRQEYKPANFHGGYSNRDVTLREALARSLNVPTVELAMRVGLAQIADTAEDCGLERPRAFPSMALGTSEVTPLELAGAYTAFANDGKAMRPIPIRSVEGNSLSGVNERVTTASTQVFSPQVAYLMTNLMQSVVNSGTASSLRGMGLTGAIAGKTGTSNDGWFVGYTPNLVCVVWVGFDDNRDLRMQASDAALPIWADFMKTALEIHRGYGRDSFSRPGGIVTVEIDPATGYLAGPDCASRQQEIYLSGTEPFATCSHYDFDDQLLVAGYDEQSIEDDSTYSSASTQIEIDVCSESGLLASPTCNRSVRKTFDLGKEPLSTCMGEGRESPNEDWRAGGNPTLVEGSARNKPAVTLKDKTTEGSRPADAKRARRGEY
jgi:penicillin-binding protein 1B